MIPQRTLAGLRRERLTPPWPSARMTQPLMCPAHLPIMCPITALRGAWQQLDETLLGRDTMRDVTPTLRELAYCLMFAGNVWLIVITIIHGYP